MSDSSKLRPLASHEPGIELQEEKTTTDAPSATDGVHRRWSAESIGGDDIDTQGAAAVADQPDARLSQAQQQPGVARPTLGIEDRLYKSYTYARGGTGARIMRTGARIRTHARAYLPQSLTQKLYFEGEDPQQIEQAANMQITSRAQHTT